MRVGIAVKTFQFSKIWCERVSNRVTASASPLSWGVVILLSLCWCLLLVRPPEARRGAWRVQLPLTVREAGADIIIDHARKKPRETYQRIREKDGVVSAEYGFKNYNNDSLSVQFSITARELASYRSGYGYLATELEELLQWQRDALKAAYQSSLQEDSPTREQLAKLYEDIKASYLTKFRMLLISRGFVVQPNNVLTIDMPSIVRRNIKHVRPLAAELERQGEAHGYRSESILSSALSLVQTALLYDEVPMEVDGRRIGGMYPPMDAIFKGKGDCDSKSALLASILLNWDQVKLIGVVTPTHYLIGILRNPVRGEAFVEYKGLRYVLLEPAGPAWLSPGTIGPETEALITAGREVRIEPLTH